MSEAKARRRRTSLGGARRPRLLTLAVTLALTFGGTARATMAAQQRFPALHQNLSPPANAYEVVRGVRIPMRDGTLLSADIYRPTGRPLFPTILIRTPYGKEEPFSHRAAELFAARGYVLIAQDKRGRFESEGEYTIGNHEISDSYDTIDWIARQPWSNGRVGAYGCSDRGDAAIYAAASRHPALKAIIPEAAASAVGSAGGWYGYFGGRNGGAVELAMGLGWFAENGTKSMLRPPPHLPWDQFIAMRSGYRLNMAPPDIDFDQAVRALPIVSILWNHGLSNTDWDNLAGRELDDPFFASLDFLRGNERFDTPALHVNSWYDFGVAQTLYERELFIQNGSPLARDNQFAVISPSLHCQTGRMTANYIVGSRPVGDPQINLDALYIRWFDHWLKGTPNDVARMPRIHFFEMGSNIWRTASAWPAPGARGASFLLGGGTANGPNSSGTLSETRGGRGIARDRFTYDPANPVPSIGGSLCCIRSDRLEGAYDQREAERRPDVLTYTTAPFPRGLSLAGPVEVVLYISSSARDTDFTAKLVDVYPNGTAYNLTEGILRVRYRNGFDQPELMTPGSNYEIRIRLQDTANYFAPGHAMRLEISSSNFPRFDRNLNTGGRNYDETQWVHAQNMILRDVSHPSRLEVRVLRAR